MKILYITPDITNSGGIARVISLKANYLVSVLGYEVCILSPNKAKSDFFYDFNPKIEWKKFDNSKNKLLFSWNYFRLIRKTIAQKKPDIIIVCDAVSWVFIPWLVKTKMPILFETHVSISLKKILNNGLRSNIRPKIVQFFKKITARKFDKYIFETQAGSKEWNIKNSIVIPNPISFVSQNLASLENKKAIAVCRHSYEKGIDRLLVIWKKVLKNHPDWNLDIYGQWDSDLRYQKMAESFKISKNVNFIAPTIDIQNRLNQASVFLMTSRSEAFGMVLIEAMACGLPCIAYDCPIGPSEIIENKVDGFLIEDDNIDLFVEKVALLIEDKSLRLEMGKKAKKSIEKYNIDEMMQKWNELFIDILSKST
ncbi:MAG: glycosyltransferase family 4 protein [Flavobacteriaceae bacterium]|nr:glycosyltransferase family 4 protein [Flavobacteriaceae bacterium]